jgi:hypothetical protein
MAVIALASFWRAAMGGVNLCNRVDEVPFHRLAMIPLCSTHVPLVKRKIPALFHLAANP